MIKVGIIGPTNVPKLSKLMGKSQDFLLEKAHLIGMMANKENFRKPDMLFHLRTDLTSDKMGIGEEVSRLEKLSKDQLYENLVRGTHRLVPSSEALMVAYFSQLKNYNSNEFSFLKR